MLNPGLLPGHMDTDMVFSMVKLIPGYLCIKFFCCVISDLLFVIYMQIELHSHGSYQDYISELGSSEIIITDNSKTQTGKKWYNTSRDVIKNQRKLNQYNQNCRNV